MPNVSNSVFAILFSCLSVMAVPVMAAGTSDGSSATASKPTYEQAKASVDAGKFAEAETKLISLTVTEPANADAWNLLGFTYRKLGQLDKSSAAYLKVLTINPNHLGALEYQGELFITTGKLDLAKANLTKLKGLCGNCEEAQDLAKSLKKAGV